MGGTAEERSALRTQLLAVVQAHGTQVLDDAAQLGAVAADLAPARRAERRALQAAIRAGQPARLRQSVERGVLVTAAVDAAVRDGQDAGATAELARWVVETLVECLRLEVPTEPVRPPPGPTWSVPAPELLVPRVRELTDQFASRCAGPSREAVLAVQARLAQPLRVALVGRVSSGKSTLLNALLGRRLAATAAGECTRTTVEYRYGRWHTARVVTVDGRVIDVPIPDGEAVTALPLPLEAVSRVEVTDRSETLRTLTLIDSPGLSAGGSDASARTLRLLDDSGDGFQAPDALLFVLNGPLTGDEHAAVEAFRAASRRSPSAVVLAVLSKADRIGPDPGESWQAAVELATSTGSRHRDLFTAVAPVVGLLAETGRTGLTGAEAADLRALADAWDPATTALALCDAELFRTTGGPVPAQRRVQLLARLGLFGVGELLIALREGCAGDPSSLADVAVTASGLPQLVDTLDHEVGSRADPVQAGRALAGLRAAAYLPGADRELLDAVEVLELSDEMLPVQLVRARALVTSGRLAVPDRLGNELLQATAPGGLPRTPADDAAAHATAWRSWALLASEAGRRVADTMARAWYLAGGLR